VYFEQAPQETVKPRQAGKCGCGSPLYPGPGAARPRTRSREKQRETGPALEVRRKQGKEQKMGRWGLPEVGQVVYGRSP